MLQQSCGILGHLKDIVLSHVQQEPTPDLNPDTLSALAAVMLAQAQESIYRKATSGQTGTAYTPVDLLTDWWTESLIDC